jgi:hypothetical protein
MYLLCSSYLAKIKILVLKKEQIWTVEEKVFGKKRKEKKAFLIDPFHSHHPFFLFGCTSKNAQFHQKEMKNNIKNGILQCQSVVKKCP